MIQMQIGTTHNESFHLLLAALSQVVCLLAEVIEEGPVLDDGNFEKLNQYTWYEFKNGQMIYARTKIYKNKKVVKCPLMHNLILDKEETEIL